MSARHPGSNTSGIRLASAVRLALQLSPALQPRLQRPPTASARLAMRRWSLLATVVRVAADRRQCPYYQAREESGRRGRLERGEEVTGRW